MRIELFGYYFYPAFFITLIGVPLLIVLTIILIRRLKERRQVYSTSRITSWEKKYIPVILKKEKREAQNEHYEKTLEGLIEYVEECTYWNTDELLEIDIDAIIILTSVLFDEIKKEHTEDPDKCILLLHAIDNLNGGIDYELGKHWMADDMTQLNNHEKMGIDEAKVLALCESSVERTINEYVDLDSNKIPLITNAYSEMIGLTREDFGSALRDIDHCVDFTDMKEATYNILELTMIDLLDKIITTQENDFFDGYYLSYFRTLACIIDRQLYDDILKTIEK